MGDEDSGHRLDGFDSDAALDEIRALVSDRHGAGDRLAELVSLLDHWLIVGEPPPSGWRWPDPALVAERVMSRQPKRTTRSQRRR